MATLNNQHPNSLEATADPQTRAIIRKGRKQADFELQLMERWGRNGCVAATETAEHGSYSTGGVDG